MCSLAPRSYRLSPIEFRKLYETVLSTVVFISYTEFLDSTKLTGNDYNYNLLRRLSFCFIEKYTFQFIMIDQVLNEHFKYQSIICNNISGSSMFNFNFRSGTSESYTMQANERLHNVGCRISMKIDFMILFITG